MSLNCAKIPPTCSINFPDFILTSYYAISSILHHFPHDLLGSACRAKTTATAEKLWEKMFNLCKPQPTCSINIPNTNTVLKPSHFIHLQPFQTTSTRRRGAASTMRTAAKSWKKLLNWGKPQPICSINIPRLDCGLIRCHFIHLRLFQTDVHLVARRRVDDEDCAQIVNKGVELG